MLLLPLCSYQTTCQCPGCGAVSGMCCQQTGLPTDLRCKTRVVAPHWVFVRLPLSWSFDQREQVFLAFFCLCLWVLPDCKPFCKPGLGCMGDKKKTRELTMSSSLCPKVSYQSVAFFYPSESSHNCLLNNSKYV